MEKRRHWKLANDTFGETYHFSRLHKNTLGQIFCGDALGYEGFGRNHRFVMATRQIDELRDQPENACDREYESPFAPSLPCAGHGPGRTMGL